MRFQRASTWVITPLETNPPSHRSPHVGAPEQHQNAGLKLIAPIVVLACGHMLSNMIRTLPAVSIDLIAADMHVNAATVGSLAGAYHFAFAAGQIPLGVALDRFSVRTVSVSLLFATIISAAFAALSRTPLEFCLAQITLGLATSGVCCCAR